MCCAVGEPRASEFPGNHRGEELLFFQLLPIGIDEPIIFIVLDQPGWQSVLPDVGSEVAIRTPALPVKLLRQHTMQVCAIVPRCEST